MRPLKLRTLIRSRIQRGLDLHSIGPNEARIIYDGFVSMAAALTALGYSAVYLHQHDPRTVLLLATLPVQLVVFAFFLGIYSRLRKASWLKKALGLLACVLLCASVCVSFGASISSTVLWLLLVYPPLLLARLILLLPSARSPKPISFSVNHRGPILVIGGAGYIGTHTVDLLLQRGSAVRVLDRLMYGREPIREFVDKPNFDLIEGDVTDIARLAQAMNGASAVIHLSGLVGDPACAVDTEFTRHTNIIATRMAKDVAQAMGINKFIFASSCSVYGVSEQEVCETDPLNPVSLYAQTKIDSERELLAALRDDFFVTILRFATVFGDSRRPRFDLVGNLFTAQAMTDGLITVIGPNQCRPFIHVRDLARAVIKVLDADPIQIQNQVFNVGDRRLNMTIMELAEKVCSVCKQYRDVTISTRDNPEDRRNYRVSFDKIRSVLDFQAETLIEPGIREMALSFQTGRYGPYRDHVYSNVAMTARALSQFHDPAELSRLYAPLKVM